MAVRAPRSTKRRTPLTRERALRAAIELADQGGFELPTMRKLTGALGAEAMPLYNRVANNLVEVVGGHVAKAGYDCEFVLGLDLILEGLDRLRG